MKKIKLVGVVLFVSCMTNNAYSQTEKDTIPTPTINQVQSEKVIKQQSVMKEEVEFNQEAKPDSIQSSKVEFQPKVMNQERIESTQSIVEENEKSLETSQPSSTQKSQELEKEVKSEVNKNEEVDKKSSKMNVKIVEPIVE